MRLENYLLEYKKILVPAEANKIIRKNCSDYYTHALNRYYLYRGVNEIEGPIFIDPSQRVRTGSGMSKIFMDLIDNMPEWKEYPKRSRSLMASTSLVHAKGFGRICMIFPFDGSRLAVAPTKDFNMGSFIQEFRSIGIAGGMVHMTDAIENLYEWINDGRFLNLKENSYPELIKLSKEIEKRKGDEDWIYELADADHIPIGFKMALRSESLIDILRRIVNPKSGGFKLAETNEYIRGNHEIWTDGKCVVMPIELWQHPK